MSSRQAGTPTSEAIMTRWSYAAFLFFALAILSLAAPAKELRPLVHHGHRRWLDGSEVPAPVVAMAQERDRLLQLATGGGLFRFEGSRFERWSPDVRGRRHELPHETAVDFGSRFQTRTASVQTSWFILFCALLAVPVLWGLYRLLVAQLTARIRNGLEERTQARERRARELHDTLLQGVQGVILRFQAVADRLPDENVSKRQLEAALDAADKVVVDARDRARDLRGDDTTADLGERVEQLVAETPFDRPIPVRILLEGRARAVDPLIATEVAKIVREALLNVSYHARARTAEIAVGYDARHLAIRMRDDGRGIPAQVMATGRREGHFGMVGMRERAARIGGSLTISSVDGGGTEVLLTLPARLAFARRKTADE